MHVSFKEQVVGLDLPAENNEKDTESTTKCWYSLQESFL